MRQFIKITILLMMSLLLPGIVCAAESFTAIAVEQNETPVVEAPQFISYGANHGVKIFPTTEGSDIMYRVYIYTDYGDWELVNDWTLYEGRDREIWCNGVYIDYMVEAYAFIGENMSETVTYESYVYQVYNNEYYHWIDFDVDGVYYYTTGDKAIVTHGVFSCCYSGEVIIPETVTYSGKTYSVTAIGDNTFCGSGLTSIIVPNTITSIGSNAFLGTPWYNNQPDGIVYAGPVAYKYKGTMLDGTSIILRDGTVSITNSAFYGCSGLTSITIPNSVTSIGDGAFSYCSGLNTITIENGNPVYDSRDNCNAIIHTSDNKIIAGCKNTIIPNTVTSIDGQELTLHVNDEGPDTYEYDGYGAFSGIEMESLTIPVNITNIGHGAFSGSYIKKIYYNSLDCGSYYYVPGAPHAEPVYSYPFASCCADEFIIGGNISQIPSGLAAGSYISTVVIPNSVTSIGNHAFGYIGNFIIPNSVSFYYQDYYDYGYYSDHPWDYCDNLYIIGEGGWPNCFPYSDDGIYSGYEVTYDNLYIDAGITSVGGYDLPLTDIYCYATMPPRCNESTFSDYSGILHVPAASLASYFTAPYWGNFANIVGDLEFPNSIALSEDALEIRIGKSFNLTATVFPLNTNFDFFKNWQTTNPAVATVSQGIVTAMGEGECDITVSCLGKTAMCHVTVVGSISLSLDQTEVRLEPNSSVVLKATILPESESGLPVTWTTSNPWVAAVNNGIVTAVDFGECDITATCLGEKAVCHVTVAEPVVVVTIELDQQEAMVLPNHIITLTPSASPVMPYGFTASSSDPTIASPRIMNGTVQVVGIKEGTVTITVGSADGAAIPATCLVTVYTEMGDVNCDGFITISDVTSLINYLLSGDDSIIKVENADLNFDGKVSITDVTTLINYLLSGEWPSVEPDDHEWVDLGLPSGTLWATCNVGASAPEEFGDYFAWGETTPRDVYDWTAYNWSAGSSTTMTKYCTSSSYGYEGFTDNKTELDLEDDAAYVNWGKKWRMPTYEQLTELHTQCTWTWTTQNGVKGYLVTGPNGNTMFVPAAGYHSESTHYSAGTEGRYWLSTLYSDRADHSYCLYFNSGSVSWDDSRRYRGFSVRAVRASQH